MQKQIVISVNFSHSWHIFENNNQHCTKSELNYIPNLHI